jgi:Abortive infection alpha
MTGGDPIFSKAIETAVSKGFQEAEDFALAVLGSEEDASLGRALGRIVRRQWANFRAVNQKAQLIILNLGLDSSDIPLPVLKPLIEGASLEEDESLQNTWANLLANASDARKLLPINAAYSAILRELSATEVRLLTALETAQLKTTVYDQLTENQIAQIFYDIGLSPIRLTGLTYVERHQHEKEREHYRDLLEHSLDILKRNQLIKETLFIEDVQIDVAAGAIYAGERPDSLSVDSSPVFVVTALGRSFIRACSTPVAKALS